MNSDFTFIDFKPDAELRLKCENTLVRLLEFGPFTAQAYDSTPEGALEAVARFLSRKLNRWRKPRNLSESIERMVPDRFTG